jgi:hypothetical protein
MFKELKTQKLKKRNQSYLLTKSTEFTAKEMGFQVEIIMFIINQVFLAIKMPVWEKPLINSI